MRVLLSTYGSRGDVEPLVGLAVALKALGVEPVVSAPADHEFVAVLARAGVELAPAFMAVRDWIAMARRSPMDIPAYGAKMISAQYEAIDAAAEGCDAVVGTGLMPSVGAAQCVAEKRGLLYEHVTFCPLFLPSHHHRPFPYPGHAAPSEMTDPRALWDHNIGAMNALFGHVINRQRTDIGLPPVDNIRDHVFTQTPLLASDPILWPWEPTDLCDPVQTGAWILKDERPLPNDLETFLDAGTLPVYLGFGSIAIQHAEEIAAASIRAIRANGQRAVLARGWAGLAPVDDQDDCFLVGEVNQQALFKRVSAVIHHGGAGTTTTASMAGAPQIIVPQIVDQPYWAARVAGLRIGVAHDGPNPTFESLSASIEKALTPAVAQRAKAVSNSLPTDGASVAAAQLIETIERKGTRLN